MDVDAVVRAGARLGEGPVWDTEQACLYWVDIEGERIHRYDPATGVDETQQVAGQVGVVVPRASGIGLLAAIDRRVVVLPDAFAAGATEGPAREEPVADLPTGDRANDGACDPAGRFLVGTLAPGEERSCGLYRVEGAGQVSTMVAEVTLSNGLDWSPDGATLYFADTPTNRLDAFDYDVTTGALTRRRTFVDLADGPWRPDGLTVDAEGGVWVVLARSGRVHRYDPSGRLDAVVTLPAHRVTSCAFGGPELDELYVTSGRFTMTPAEIAAEPLAGSVFRLRPGVRGRPAFRWVDVR